MANVYDIGDCVRCRGLFRDPDTWAEVDPDNVFFEIKDPDGVTATYQYGVSGSPVTRADVGDYQVRVTVTASGEWYYHFYSTGTGPTAEERSFSVRPTQFP